MVDEAHLVPFLKWAGGKRQLLDALVCRTPSRFGTYYEPFIGAGALLFQLAPRHARINDVNKELVNTYVQLRDNLADVVIELDKLDSEHASNPKSTYYDIRDRYNGHILDGVASAESAAQFIYLNKHCFNGLYRVNSRGLFNVPYNNSMVSSYSYSNLQAVSCFLRDTHISVGDFEDACELAGPGDFVYLDSPYAPLNPTSFESYTSEGFSLEDHRRLAALYSELTHRGCYCMLSNHDTPLIRELYEPYILEQVSVRRSINSDASKRFGVEVIVRNYTID